METIYKRTQTPLYIGIGFLLFVVAIELISILLLNNGTLVYVLDDAYIHLALAENIKKGHYGINIGEFSAPSSSILWPFILVPFSAYEFAPLLINITAAVGSVFVIFKILSLSIDIENYHLNNLVISTNTIFAILATNIIGLPFSGMEHSLQVLAVLIVAYGLIIEGEKKGIPRWLLSAAIVAPLIRYECLAISIGAVAYLWLRGYLKQAVLVIALTSLFVMSFSFFLLSLGLDPLPTSVLAKSSFIADEGLGPDSKSILLNVYRSLSRERQGVIMSFSALVLLSYLLFGHDMQKKHLSIAALISLCIHFMAGSYGWYHRYEIYILAFVLVVTLYICSATITNFIERNSTRLARIIILAAYSTVFIGLPYISGLFTVPLASNNIYEQQYQMHRFVVEYYNQPVAVNDLGYVSYKNENYVLDLWGLGSKKAFEYRTRGNDKDWMKKLCEDSHIGLVLIYDEWFTDIPNDWIKLGELRLSKTRITPAGSEVAFYATSKEAFSDIAVKLDEFIKTLPSGVVFVYEANR